MAAWASTSGDLIVDRRYEFAEALAAGGDRAGAAELLAQALDLAPLWAAGWFRLGEWLEAEGRLDEACAAWDRATAADPADRLGAGLKRDLARKVPMVETIPQAFVEALFDQYAERFDTALVDKLGYRAPWLLRDALTRAHPGRRFGRAMDLGCGTGLAGEVLRGSVDWLEGCDLSGAMLAQAQAKGLYDRLQKADLSALEIGAPYDLILAADVFVYLGALERIVAWCAGSLAPGGVLAFSAEAGEAPLTLRESRRFAHSQDYLQGVLAAAGFTAIRLERAVLRHDRGAAIEGFIVTASAPMALRDLQGDGEGAALV
ncbi:methyltransferase domain-containing protein [Rhodobacter sp. NTK016B]|uniref:class I SAM-dependent DNA methyltransferase n=1 Tax=Rhodobacter sp. NTK016B TaxID=2759676 RepID=UPI001A8F8B84|nr:methyltransferase [Rhodobacter sp. NTK016B]MBN8290668.1 methyltransferase domain-containing protein [Rhodobacter sp. NTK016B]